MNKTTTLGKIFHLQMGKTPSRANAAYWNGSYPWISVADLGKYEKYTEDTKEKITAKAISESKIYVVPKNTVIMSFKLTIGKTAITSEDIYTNEAVMAFLPTGKYEVSNDYFYHLFKNRDWTAETKRAVLGATLNKSVLSNIKITLPTLDEQIKIAAKLDKIDSLLASHREFIEQLQLYMEAEFAEQFGQGNHKQLPLNAICSFIDYRGRTPEKSETGIPLITAKNVRPHEFSSAPHMFVPSENYDAIMSRGIPCVNDIMFTTEAPLGNVCRIPANLEQFCIGQRIVAIQPDTERILPEYLEYALTAADFKEQLFQKASGSTVRGIRRKLLEQLTIAVPPIDQQKRFSGIVMHTERLKISAKNAISQLETLKKSLVQLYFE